MGLADKNPKNADFVVWEFFKRRDVTRFSETALAIANQAATRHKDNVYRGELGVVQSCLGNFREAIENLQPAAAEGPSVSSALAGFYLAMTYHQLGELEQAEAAFVRAVRNWKGMAAASVDEEDLTRSLWQEAQALFKKSGPSVALAGQ
jgi:tetratricopeptide (TPR) repeat protein